MTRTLSYLLFLSLLPLAALAASPYQEAVSEFKKYESAQVQRIQEKSNGYRLPGKPFLLTHGHKVKNTALLLHGLSDSPYFMKDLAKLLYDQGFNVVAPLLSGNGTVMEDLSDITAEDWKKDVRFGLKIAEGLGERVLIGGLSAGGTLAVWAAEQEPEKIQGVLLFSPALKFQKPFTAALSCTGVKKFIIGQKRAEVPIRYLKISTNGICQLRRLMKELNLSKRKDLRMPFFTVLTEYDDAIPVQWTADFVLNQPNPQNQVLVYLKNEGKSLLSFSKPQQVLTLMTPEIKHANLVLQTSAYNDETNREFAVMADALKKFIRTNFKWSGPDPPSYLKKPKLKVAQSMRLP